MTVPDLTMMRRQHRFMSLIRPLGVVSSVRQYVADRGVPQLAISSSTTGNLTMAFDYIMTGTGKHVGDEHLGGAGAAADAESAWIKAAVEGVERYATMVYTNDDFITASANELGASAIDLARLPRCSEREMADPKCRWRAPDPGLAMRWVKGYSLTHRRTRYVPAAMTHLYYHPGPNETFTQQITTGVAAHTSLAAALVSAVCEVIERDAIALTWLARIPWPRIEIAEPPRSLAPVWDCYRRGLIEQAFYDATTDIGIPTVFATVTLDDDPTCKLLVSSSTSLDVGKAVAKTIMETVACRSVLGSDVELPADIRDFYDVLHGGAYYARRGAGSDFDFLKSTPRRTLDAVQSSLALPVAASSEEQLAWVVDRLAALGMEAVAIDLTTDEVRAAGLWVVRVVVPDLIPISFMHRERYLGTPRLYRFPEAAGFGPRTEADINPAPLPFS